jgi:hypothetical protein
MVVLLFTVMLASAFVLQVVADSLIRFAGLILTREKALKMNDH